MRATSLLRRVLGLKRTSVQAVEVIDEGLVVDVMPTFRVPRCCGCGCRVRRVYDRRRRMWRHLDFGVMTVRLRYELRRVECPRCGVTTEMVPWAERGSWFTHEFEQLVGYLAQHASKTVVAALMRIGWLILPRLRGRSDYAAICLI